MSDADRESLARDVAYSLKHIPTHNHTDGGEDGQLLETTLSELEQTLTACELSLHDYDTKERFLFLRIERYREMILRRGCCIDKLLSSADYQADTAANNTTNDKITQLKIKHMQDQSNLQSVIEIHTDIIAQIETLKRRIEELEEKKQDIMTKREECYEFLVEVAEGRRI